MSYERPITTNTAPLYCEMHSRFDGVAEALRQKILALPDTACAKGGKTYYVSYRGNDDADGLSPETAWRTTLHLRSETDFVTGDAVLFERGGVYRSAYIILANGVQYGAYGEGPKPCLMGGDKDYADPALWEQTSMRAVWRAKVPTDIRDREDGIRNDIGNIIINHGEGCASDFKRLALSELHVDLEFYHDIDEDYLYFVSTFGNPGARFQSLEIAPRVNIMFGQYRNHDILVENLCLKYTGAHAVVFSLPENCTVRGCDIGYIGGSMLNKEVRYGNGIEFFGSSKGMVAELNWIYQCFDAGYTHQGKHDWHRDNIVRENLMEYSNYNIEVWTARDPAEGGSDNIVMEKNILRFAGYGFGTKNRIGSNSSAVGNISLYSYPLPHQNTVVRDNILDCSTRYLVSICYPNSDMGPTVTGNIWNQKPYHTLDSTASVDRFMDGKAQIVLGCTTQEEMEASVAKVDLAPQDITLEF